jgi:general secretion pathway protein B
VSYILEALKKAEAQRGQGQVPGIHDQHMAPEFSGGASTGGQSLLIWIIMAMGLVMIGLLVWALWEPESASNSQASVASVRPVAQGPAQAAPPPAPAVPAVPAPPPAAVACKPCRRRLRHPRKNQGHKPRPKPPFPRPPCPLATNAKHTLMPTRRAGQPPKRPRPNLPNKTRQISPRP